MRRTILILLFASVAAAASRQAQYVQAVEFPYYLYPRQLWERELVWLKTIGVDTVEFSIPWNWHQLQPGDFDFTGRTSPRRDLAAFIRILRKLDLHGWVRPLPPVAGWAAGGVPAGASDAGSRAAWLKALEALLAPQTEKHGGPIAFVEGRELEIEAEMPPSPVTTLSIQEPTALVRSRETIAMGRGALLWVNVEEALYPAGWEPPGVSPVRAGAVDFSGKERPATTALRREAALLRNWAPLFGSLHEVSLPKQAGAKLPRGFETTEWNSPSISAVSLINRREMAFHDDLRVFDPLLRHELIIPGVSVAPGEALWLPLEISLGPGGLCRDCSAFSSAERIVYATEELVTVEFENGILAMEFAAPQAGEVILQLAREPVGPYLAAGKPTKFDWDEKTLRARLPIPAGTGVANRVRIGLAIEAPEKSGFFGEARRLIIGQKNVVSTLYSSPEIASRSRLRLPEGFSATAVNKSPNEIDYTVTVPPDALHGDFASLVLEADGVPLGRARLQLFRPASIRLMQAITLHFGTQTQLIPEPPTAPVEGRGGTSVEIVVRNNSPQIQNYHLEASGEGLEFSPAKTDISIGALDERPVSLRIFAKEGISGLRDWRLRVTGGDDLDLPFRVIVLGRGNTAVWTADLDGDGYPEWVLESQRVRAVFASPGARLVELTWKDTNTNFVPAEGALWQSGPVEARPEGDSLEFVGNGWARKVTLNGAVLTVDQSTPLPAEGITPRSSGNVRLTTVRESTSRYRYEIKQAD
ncbi:MAG: hypothetical protein C5B51_32145 [Terriglobia bacterium]|nr:MAG: hypothetical protein C5B51_32145 [Terriglobia bacterium]